MYGKSNLKCVTINRHVRITNPNGKACDRKYRKTISKSTLVVLAEVSASASADNLSSIMYQADARNLDPEIKLKRSIEESEREREGRRRHPVHIRNHGNTRGIDDNEASDFCLFICCSL